MDETGIIRQIEQQMTAQNISQADLGRLISPAAENPRQIAHAYLSGKRKLLTGTGRAILDALNLEIVIQPKRDS